MHGLRVRRIDAVGLLDLFMLFAIGAVLVTRLYLHLTGYPQVGNGVLHIAHVLWGGLFMAISIMGGLALLSRGVRPALAILGGIGFGLFIDELGKFITRDVDYFFKPTAAIIYVVFVVMYLSVRVLVARPHMSEAEWLANAAAMAGEAATRPLAPSERGRLTALLARSPADHPLTRSLRDFVATAPVGDEVGPTRIERIRTRVFSLYARMVTTRPFVIAVIALAGIFALGAVAQIVTLIIAPGDLLEDQSSGSAIVRWAATLSTLAQGIATIIGVVLLPRSRLRGYRWLERALLVNIFLTQIFLFAEQEFAAATGLIASVLALIGLRILIAAETGREVVHATEVVAPG